MDRLNKRNFFEQEFMQKAKQLHNNKYDYSNVIYVNSRTKVKIICPSHGEFEQLPSSHLQGNGCPKCAREWTDEHKENHAESSRKSRGMTTEEWIAKARAVHNDKYDYSQTVYVNQRTSVKIICPVHGVFEQKADSHIRGNGCKFCGYEIAANKANHEWSDEQREKTKKTCVERYGAERYLDSDEGRAKIKEVRADESYRNKVREVISSDVVQDKTKATCLAKYGIDRPVKLKSVQDKIYRSKKKNHTVNSSKAEIKVNDILINRFGKNDVVHFYKDSRYPFCCDFYVKSLDLFIELNLHWSHGYHWYDSDRDSDVLRIWQERAVTSDYYKEAIYTWTVRDVKKRETALANNLNYVVFWKNDLSDFKQWLEADELILSNIF